MQQFAIRNEYTALSLCMRASFAPWLLHRGIQQLCWLQALLAVVLTVQKRLPILPLLQKFLQFLTSKLIHDPVTG